MNEVCAKCALCEVCAKCALREVCVKCALRGEVCTKCVQGGVQCCVQQLSSDASCQRGAEQPGLGALVLLGG